MLRPRFFFFLYLNPLLCIPLTGIEMRGVPFLVLIFTTHTVTCELQYITTLSWGYGLPSHKDHRLSSPSVYRFCATLSISVTVTFHCHSIFALRVQPFRSEPCPRRLIFYGVSELPTTRTLSTLSPYRFTRAAVARNETKFTGVRTSRRSPLRTLGNIFFAPIVPRGLQVYAII